MDIDYRGITVEIRSIATVTPQQATHTRGITATFTAVPITVQGSIVVVRKKYLLAHNNVFAQLWVLVPTWSSKKNAG